MGMQGPDNREYYQEMNECIYIFVYIYLHLYTHVFIYIYIDYG
jgi:hypothetical protein